MKKYIRRANGVYELKIDEKLKKANVSNCFYTSDNENKNCNILFAKKDLEKFKQADTIEELCDEYVVKHIHTLTPMLIDKFTISLKDIKTQYSGNDNFEYIYGAIWTDKGLQFVARMNSEGVLELL